MFSRKNLSVTLKAKAVAGALLTIVLSSCTSDKNSPGIEFMPDMYRPQPYEAYLEKHDIDSADFFERNIEKLSPNFEALSPEQQQAVIDEVASIYAVWGQGSATRKPVEGSVASGMKPYPFTKEEKELSKTLKSPFAYTKETLKEGKAYYEIFCDHCHGEKGDGNGPLVSLGVYPAQPPSYTGAAKDLTPGEIYHAIYYGKGVMGSHASQISEDKRWKIVMYVESLQGKKLEELGGSADSSAVAGDSVVVAKVDTVSK